MSHAILIAVCAFAMPGGNVLSDGNFDSLAPGTPPNCAQAAGAWGWPEDYTPVCETAATQYTIVATSDFDPGAVGNSLSISYSGITATIHLPNVTKQTISEESDPLVRAQFDIFVVGGGGGAFYVGAPHGTGNGTNNITDRGPQVTFTPEGTIVATNSGAAPVLILAGYPTGVWQTLRLEIDMKSDTFDAWWASEGNPLALVASDLPFRAAAGIDHIDRFTIAHFGGTTPTEASFVDNISIEIPGAADPADLNGDGAVDVNDLLLLIGAWGPCDPPPADCPADINGDGTVDVNDLLLLIGAWG